MDLIEAIQKRRSIRRFTEEPVPEAVIEKALDAAILAPNSSNAQTWDFYWVKSSDKKAKLVEACFHQSAARTAQEIVAFVADPGLWRRSTKPLQKWVDEVKAPKPVVMYYHQLLPATYRYGPLNVFGYAKWLGASFAGLMRPAPRGPHTLGELQLVSVKSAALAAENFVLAVTAQGYQTCMMEGFDEVRVKTILGLPSTARVAMCVAVGKESDRGTWGPQYRLPRDWVIHKV
jgi:nitroreductase